MTGALYSFFFISGSPAVNSLLCFLPRKYDRFFFGFLKKSVAF